MLMILTYPMHRSDALIEMNFELKCSTCKNFIAIIKNSSPAKINIRESFSRAILDGFEPYKKILQIGRKSTAFRPEARYY